MGYTPFYDRFHHGFYPLACDFRTDYTSSIYFCNAVTVGDIVLGSYSFEFLHHTVAFCEQCIMELFTPHCDRSVFFLRMGWLENEFGKVHLDGVFGPFGGIDFDFCNREFVNKLMEGCGETGSVGLTCGRTIEPDRRATDVDLEPDSGLCVLVIVVEKAERQWRVRWEGLVGISDEVLIRGEDVVVTVWKRNPNRRLTDSEFSGNPVVVGSAGFYIASDGFDLLG